MPKLLLLRHATAERARPRQSDHERELTKEGRKEAKAIGKKIAGLGDTIDLVLSSDSTRTRETWDGVALSLDEKPKVRFLQSLFEAHDYMPIIKAEGGEAKTILVIGHNPTVQETAIELAASLSGRDGNRLRSGFPKGAVAVFEFGGEWASLRGGQMKLVAFIEADEK
jgi:phosphohistidine phosphatase